MWYFVSYLLVFVILGWSLSPEYNALFYRHLFTLIQLMVFFWVSSNVLQDLRFSRKALLTYAVASFLLTLAVQMGIPGFNQEVMMTAEGGRATALGSNPNVLGLFLAVGAAILTGLVLIDKKLRRLLLLVPLISVLIFLLQTGSRGSLVAFVAGLSCFLIPSRFSRRKIFAVVLAFCALIGISYLILTDPALLTRWSRTAEGDSAGRNIILAHTLVMIRERPFLGWTPIEYQYELMRRYSGGTSDINFPQDPHNVPLNLLLEVGILGSFLFFTGIGLCARAAWKNRSKELGILPFALITTILVNLQFHSFSTSKPLWLVLAACTAAGGFASSRLDPRKGLRTSYRFNRFEAAGNPMRQRVSR
jgi:O-antigen ligase